MNKIKEFRKKKNLSQSDMSKILGIKQNTFSQWENDIRMPKVEQAIKISEYIRNNS